MHTSIRCRILVALTGLMLLVSGAAFGQITINSSDYTYVFGQDFQQYDLMDTLGTGIPVTVGTTGGPQTWTFNQQIFPGGENFVFSFVDPATTPFASDFPDADHAQFFADDSGSFYFFINQTPSALLGLGTGFLYSGPNADTLVEVNDPIETLIPFPLQMGTTFNDTSVSRFEPFPGFLQVDSSISSSEIDAWGTVELPGGNYQALRAKTFSIDYSLTYIGGVLTFSDTSTYIDYAWLTTGNLGLIAEIESMEGETDPNFTMASFVAFRDPSGVTGVAPTPRVVEGFELRQNYPNPFNPETTIRYVLPRAAEIDLAVFNLTGQRVATLVEGRQSAGEHTATFRGDNLASGVYFYRLRSGATELTQRMILLK